MEVSSRIIPGQDALQHRAATGCMMTALPCCCSCADRRPQAAAYPVYVDGKGIRMQGKRWQRYCRKCHDYWQSLASEPDDFGPARAPPPEPHIAAQADMSLPHMRYHNRYGGLSHPPEDEHPQTDSTMPPSNMSTVRTSVGQSRSITNQTTNSSNTTEQVYPLGSREDVQQDDYESPLAGMFGRAYGRYREAEAARQAAQAQGYEAISSWNRHGQFTTSYRPSLNPLLDPAMAGPQTQERQARTQDNINVRLGQSSEFHSLADSDIYAGLAQSARNMESFATRTASGTRMHTSLDPRATHFVPDGLATSETLRSSTRRQRSGFHRQFYTDTMNTASRTYPLNNSFENEDDATNPIDAQLARPSPFKSEDLRVDLACKICTEQKINTVCMPCMHACMCRWCAAIHKNDCRDYETGRWSGALWKCPICRKTIHEVKRLYI